MYRLELLHDFWNPWVEMSHSAVDAWILPFATPNSPGNKSDLFPNSVYLNDKGSATVTLRKNHK